MFTAFGMRVIWMVVDVAVRMVLTFTPVPRLRLAVDHPDLGLSVETAAAIAIVARHLEIAHIGAVHNYSVDAYRHLTRSVARQALLL
jgi:hypothetical protein